MSSRRRDSGRPAPRVTAGTAADGVVRALVEHRQNFAGPGDEGPQAPAHGLRDVVTRLVGAELVTAQSCVLLVEMSRRIRHGAEGRHVAPEVVALGSKETREAR